MGDHSVPQPDYQLLFVKAPGPSESLELAFKSMEVHNLEPTWISYEDCFKINEKDPAKIFVSDPFCGDVFDHLEKVRCRIVGPICILMCLAANKPIPRVPNPLYSVVMKDVIVTCTNMDRKQKEDVERKVLLMGGLMSKVLVASVTHLITNDTGSKKYFVAGSLNLPLMLPSWIDECWNFCKNAEFDCNDESLLAKHRCPIFRGCRITVSQINSAQRSAISELVKKHGGEYSGNLNIQETTHLVLSEPTGKKYVHARKGKVHCVSPQWIYDSIKREYCLDWSLYDVNESTGQVAASTSTPEEKNNVPRISADISMLNFSKIEPTISSTNVDETVMTEFEMTFLQKGRVPNAGMNAIKQYSEASKVLQELDKLKLQDVKKLGLFFDGCRIFIHGFTGTRLEKLLRIVNFGGGTRFSQMSESVTHVIVSDNFNENALKLTHEPKIVHLKWLIDCCKMGKLLSEKAYLWLGAPPITDNSFSPISVKRQKMIEGKENVSHSKKNLGDEETMMDGMDEVLSQYVISNNGNVKKVSSPPEKACGDHSDVKPVDSNVSLEESRDCSNSSVFSNLKFVISSLIKSDEHEFLLEGIETRGGIILSIDNVHDYVVVPSGGDDSLATDKPMVTFYWIEYCALEERIVNPKEDILFQPVPKNLAESRPLKGSVVTLSLYSSTERISLLELAQVLGATCQEFFLRVSKGDALANTHLVIPERQGSKYNAAKRWGIPTVTKDWLLDTIKLGKRPEEKYYDVENPVPKPESYFPSIQNVADVRDIAEEEGLSYNKSKDVSLIVREEISDHGLVSSPDRLAQTKMAEITQKNPDTPIPDAVKTPNQFTTPDIPQKSRLHALRSSSAKSSFEKRLSGAKDLPGNYLDLSAMSAAFDTPTLDKNSPILRRDSSQNFQADCQHYMNLAMEKHGKSVKPVEPKHSTGDADDGPLSGVTIVVSKKLVKTQGELNNLAASLGASYKWSYDESCTHLIHQGKPNEASRDLRRAKVQNRFVVSPAWLDACKRENERVDEAVYPFTYNSKMNLSSQVLPVKVPNSPKQSPQIKVDNDHPKLPITPSAEENCQKESNDALYKQLDDLMSAAKSDSGIRTRQRRIDSIHNNSDGCRMSTPGIDKKLQVKPSTDDICTESLPIDSQRIGPITWDDPTSRKEREVIAGILAQQETQETEPIQTNDTTATQTETDDEISIIAEVLTTGQPDSDSTKLDLKVATKSDSAQCEPEVEPEKQCTNHFMLTGFQDDDREKYCEIISQLGGIANSAENFDKDATHLIANKPSKSEKFLASIAAGLWILCPLYLEHSMKSGTFIGEEDYEWGCDNIMDKMNMPDPLKKIARSTTRWRKAIAETRRNGAFSSWKVILIVEGEKRARLGRLLDAGGAKLLDVCSPFPRSLDATHAFIDASKKSPITIDLTNLLNSNVLCVLVNYIPSYLLENEETDPTYFSVEGLMQGSFSDKKRKINDTTNKSMKLKRSRQKQ